MESNGATGDTGAEQVDVLRLLSFNIHAATTTDRFHHYVTHSWRQLLPHHQRSANLDAIADLVRDYDIVALQEADAGSLRSGFINQSRYIAIHGDMPAWHHQANRKLGAMTFTSNGFVGKFSPTDVEEHRLPGAIPGRGALLLRFGLAPELVVVNVHLALGRRARRQQLSYLARHLSPDSRLVIMGDFNADADGADLARFRRQLDLDAPTAGWPSYPSWQPSRSIDHIMISRGLGSAEVRVIDAPMSDHCPVALTLRLRKPLRIVPPERVGMHRAGNSRDEAYAA